GQAFRADWPGWETCVAAGRSVLQQELAFPGTRPEGLVERIQLRQRLVVAHVGPPSAARVDDGARARRRLHVLHHLAIRYLARAAFTAKLTHRFDVQGPTLHVGIGEMPSIGVDRQRPAQAERAVLYEPSRLALRAEAQPFQAEQHRRAEIVVAHQRVDILVRHARHAVGLLTRGTQRRIPEIHVEIGNRGWREGFLRAEAGDQHRWLAEIPRTFLRRQYQADRTVIDQAVVQQAEGRGDEARRFMILDGDRVAHHRVWIE